MKRILYKLPFPSTAKRIGGFLVITQQKNQKEYKEMKKLQQLFRAQIKATQKSR